MADQFKRELSAKIDLDDPEARGGMKLRELCISSLDPAPVSYFIKALYGNLGLRVTARNLLWL